MKKLMMCLVAVVVACTAKAASVEWGVTGLFGNGDIVGTVALASGTFSSIGTIDGTSGTVSGSFSKFTWGTAPFATGSAWDATVSVKGLDGNMYEKVFALTLGTVSADDDRANADMFQGVVDNFALELMPDGWLDESVEGLAAAGFTKAGGGVPEPTSGLLLLVGGAMLALRRRRA